MGWDNKVSSSKTSWNFLDDVRSLDGCFLPSILTSLRFYKNMTGKNMWCFTFYKWLFNHLLKFLQSRIALDSSKTKNTYEGQHVSLNQHYCTFRFTSRRELYCALFTLSFSFILIMTNWAVLTVQLTYSDMRRVATDSARVQRSHSSQLGRPIFRSPHWQQQLPQAFTAGLCFWKEFMIWTS